MPDTSNLINPAMNYSTTSSRLAFCGAHPIAFRSCNPIHSSKVSTFTPMSLTPINPTRKATISNYIRHHIRATAAPAATPTSSTSIPSTTSFRKYHGLGNDFVLIDNRHSTTPVLTPEQAASVCDRNTGVGADGVIFLLPAERNSSHCSMRLYNSDGTEPEMCGNGIRCLARFAEDIGVPSSNGSLIVDTLAGPIIPQFIPGSKLVRVDMGAPILEGEHVPTKLKCTQQNGYVDQLMVDKDMWDFTAVSMGNPHAITFVSKQVYDQVDRSLETIGPLVTEHEKFPAMTNSEFVYVKGKREFDMVVWERGAGRTMACGTGACAVLVAAVLTGRADKDTEVTIHLPGGDLIIEWLSSSDHILMTGPAELVFEGKLMGL